MRARKRKAPTMQLVAALSKAHGARCGICGMPLTAHGVEVDHIVPVAAGGSDARRNLRLVHQACNRSRGSRL